MVSGRSGSLRKKKKKKKKIFFFLVFILSAHHRQAMMSVKSYYILILIVCVLSYFVNKIDIKCRNHELWLILEGEVTSPYCQGLAGPLLNTIYFTKNKNKWPQIQNIRHVYLMIIKNKFCQFSINTYSRIESPFLDPST